jgi:hypothetical protein
LKNLIYESSKQNKDPLKTLAGICETIAITGLKAVEELKYIQNNVCCAFC